MPTLQQDILVRIDTLINGLPQMRAFSEGIQKLKSTDGKKISFGDPKETNQLATSIERLATAVEKIDDAKIGKVGQLLKGLVFTVSVLSNIPAAFEGLKVIERFVTNAPQLSSKLATAGTAVSGFFSAARDKLGAGASLVKEKVASIAEGLPKLSAGLGTTSAGLLGVGAAGTVAAGGLIAVLGAVAAIVIALVAVAVISTTLFKLAQSAADAGDNFDELNKRTGVSVEILSALAPVLEDSGSSLDEFANGVSKLNKKIGEAAAGSKEATQDLKQFGIEPLEAINNQEAALGKVFKRIVDLPPGIQRSIAAQKAFGKSGDELVPTIEAINGNLDAQITKTKALGLLWSGPAAKAAGEFNDKLAEIHRTVAGLAIAIGRALIPELLRLLRIFAHEMPRAGGAFSVVLGFIALEARRATNAIILLIAAANTLKSVPAAIAASVVAGGPAGALIIGSTFLAEARRLRTIADAEGSAQTPSKKLAFPPGGGGSKKKSNPADIFDSVFGLDRAKAEAAFNLTKDSLDRQTKLVEEAFEKRKLTIAEFYETQLDLQTRTIDAEIKKLGTLRLAEERRLANELNKIDKNDEKLDDAEKAAQIAIETNQTETALIGINEQLVILYRSRAVLAHQIDKDQTNATRSLQDELQTVIDAIDRSNGRGALVDAREQTKGLVLLMDDLRENGQETAAQLVEEFLKFKFAIAATNVELEKFQRGQEVGEAVIARIREQGSRNLVTQFLAEQAVKEIRRAQITEAEALLQKLEAIARTTQDPATLIAVEQQRAAVARLKNEYRTLGQTIKDTFIDSAVRGVEDFLLSLKDLFSGVRSLGDVFRAVALSIIEDISRIIAKMIALKIITTVIGIFSGPTGGGGGGGGGFFTGAAAAGGEFFARPGGRLIQVAEAGHDELVVSTDPSFAKRTAGLLGRFIQRTGILPRFDGLNSGSILSNISSRIPSFAAGDFVEPDLSAVSAGAGNLSLVQNISFPGVKDHRGFVQNQQTIKRDLARAAQQGLSRLRGVPR